MSKKISELPVITDIEDNDDLVVNHNQNGSVKTSRITKANMTKSFESSSNKTTTITSSSTDDQYPSAAAVWSLFNSITDGNEVGY